MKVGDIMTGRVISVDEMEPVSAAARLMNRHNLGALPVCDAAGRLKGIITDRDIVTRCIASDTSPQETCIREIMSRGIRTCTPEDDVSEAAGSMCASQIRRLPVISGSRLVGMVSLCDLARSRSNSMEAAKALSDISANITRR